MDCSDWVDSPAESSLFSAEVICDNVGFVMQTLKSFFFLGSLEKSRNMYSCKAVVSNCCAIEVFIVIPPANCVCGWVYCFHVVRPSVRSSITFCFLNI